MTRPGCWPDRSPTGHCIGLLTVLPLTPPSPQAAPDTLFLTHGRIPKDAVC